MWIPSKILVVSESSLSTSTISELRRLEFCFMSLMRGNMVWHEITKQGFVFLYGIRENFVYGLGEAKVS